MSLSFGFFFPYLILALHYFYGIEKYPLFQPEPFPVGTGLFRTRIIRVYRNDRAIYRTHRTFDALLEIVLADIVFLYFHSVQKNFIVHGSGIL